MDGYLTKPLRGAVLQQAIESRLTAAETAVGEAKEEAVDTGEPIRLGELLERCMGKATIAKRVLEVFQKQAGEYLAKVEESAGKADAAGLAKMAHTLKGAAANVSAEGIRRCAAELERMGMAGQLKGIEQAMAPLREEVGRCLEHAPKVLETLSAQPPLLKPAETAGS
jgi:HPt (histidine-containing phosphotransfer) domain-containing protein